MTDSQPVSCDLHTECELLAMRRARVWLDAALPTEAVQGLACRVLDVCSRDGGEFLELQTEAGERFSCRLDQLRMLCLEDGRQIFGDSA